MQYSNREADGTLLISTVHTKRITPWAGFVSFVSTFVDPALNTHSKKSRKTSRLSVGNVMRFQCLIQNDVTERLFMPKSFRENYEQPCACAR